ncbi:MAG TPA: YncE family protein [Gaiellaceae bacterium]|jgi:DNA-binding beta-propeller fold protein YncE|nr:YncE family protein [Gaiellaceae bacterium]
MRPLVIGLLAAVVLLASAPAADGRTSRPVALVTAETSNEVLAVSLGPHGGRVLRRIHLVDPLMIASPLHGPAIVVSPTGTVTLLGRHSLRPIAVLRSFRDPQVAAIAPGGSLAYVADDATGKLSVVDLARRKVVDRVFVGARAHHLSFSPDGRRLWVALGETATTIVRLDTTDQRKPRVAGRLHPPVAAHDVRFAPGGRQVWVTSAAEPYVMVFAAATGKLLREVPAGAPPQHIAFSGSRALVTSGYGSSLEAVSARTYRRLGVVPMPYGSFNLSTFGGRVVTTSLLTGQVSELGAGRLNLFWTRKEAPAARYVAITLWPRR